jgi:tRNA A-37 threonylcarbamoyl transferase component Bud32
VTGAPRFVGYTIDPMVQLRELTIPRFGRVRLLDTDLHLVCDPEVEEELVRIYRHHEWVYDLLQSQNPAGFRGRHPVLKGEIGGQPCVVKRLYHGGSTASLWKDRFLSAKRARGFLSASLHLREEGIPTPRLIFLSWLRRNGLVRAEMGFERIFGPDADHYLFQGDAPQDWEERARQIGRLVSKLHRARFEHGDLNLMNLLFSEEGELFVIDLDKVVVHHETLSAEIRRRNLSRLERSVRKQGRIHGSSEDYSEAIVEQIREGYDEHDPYDRG